MDKETQEQLKQQLLLQKEAISKLVAKDRIKVKVGGVVYDAIILRVKENAVGFNDFRIKYEGYEGPPAWVAGSQVVL